MEHPMARFNMNMNAVFGGGMPHSEVISVPDRMVGLIIGKGGEQIASIQNESECKIQFAPADNSGMTERQCTLTGTSEAIQKAKELIGRIMNKGHDLPDMQSDGNTMIEMMIPGNKAGIVIGKGGETIKQLQERAGVRMVIIQESNTPTSYDKPLRITGDHNSCQRAKELVLDLLAEKDNVGGSGFGDFDRRSSVEIAVPRSMIGVVIGKGGEMIKKIQQDSGARIQFRPEDELGGPHRMCNITGTHEQAQSAQAMINELIETTAQRQGLGSGWTRPAGARFDGTFDGRPRSDQFGDETTFAVPAEKCGLVIGKGGDTIREICRQSGAHVELNRDQNPTSLERVFRVTGTPEQIQQAIRLIGDKAGIPTPTRDASSLPTLSSLPPAITNMVYGSSSDVTASQNQQPLTQLVAQNFAAVPGWNNTSQYQQYSQPNAVDLGKSAVDQNMTAWNAYYAAVAAQAAAQSAQPFGYQAATQPTAQPVAGQPTSPYAAATALARTTVTPQPSINPVTGQLDYSAAWAEYYRQQGMHQHANAILQAASHGVQHPQ